MPDLLGAYLEETARHFERLLALIDSNRRSFLEVVRRANPRFGDAVISSLTNKGYLQAAISFERPLALNLGWLPDQAVERPQLVFPSGNLTVYGNGHFQRRLGDMIFSLHESAPYTGQIVDQTHESYMQTDYELLSSRDGEWRFTSATP